MYHWTFFHLYVGVRCHTGLSNVSPFLSCQDHNSDERKKKKLAELECATLKLQGTAASWQWSAQLTNTYPLEKQERWLLQLLLEMLPLCESHLYVGIWKISGYLEVSYGNLYMPFLDIVPRKYLPWKNITESVIGRAHIQYMLNICIYKILHKDTHLVTLRKLRSFSFDFSCGWQQSWEFLWTQNINHNLKSKVCMLDLRNV